MIITVISDLHLTDKKPKNRKDEYWKTGLSKFDFILKNTEDVLLIGGDFFDYANLPDWFVGNVFLLLEKHKKRILVVPGQHDLRYHTKGLSNTSLGVIQSAGHIEILSPEFPIIINGIKILGLGWEEKLIHTEGDILVTHQMVTYKKELWAGQTNFSTGPQILHKYKNFKCIVSGDNHRPHFYKTEDGRFNINCGSIMRSSKDQIDYQPKMWLIDTDDWNISRKNIPIEDSKNVFDFSKIEKEEKNEEARAIAQEKINKLIGDLGNKKEKPDYKMYLREIVKKINPNENVKTIINNIMEEITS